MKFDPFASDQLAGTGHSQKKRSFLVGNKDKCVHFLAKLALYRGQSINCYNLVTKERKKLEGRSTPNFDAIRKDFMDTGHEIPYPNDIPEADVERWVEYGMSQAKKLGLEIKE
jgi:hypothetical protein